MRYTLGFVLAAGLLTVCPMTAQAQEDRVDFSLGGGFTAPNSEVRDHLGDGYNFNFGVQVNVSRAVAIEGLYSFNGLGDKRISVPLLPTPLDDGTAVPTDLSANMNMQYFTVSAVFQRPEGSGVRPYGLIGMGAYYRPVEVTSPSLGFAPGFCDPFWYVCYPGQIVAVEDVIGKRSSTDFGMDFGGGVNFGTFYSELRYHYIWGPTVPEIGPVQPLPGVSSDRKANGQFLQFTFGFRF